MDEQGAVGVFAEKFGFPEQSEKLCTLDKYALCESSYAGTLNKCRDAVIRRNKTLCHRTGNDLIACSYSAETSASARFL